MSRALSLSGFPLKILYPFLATSFRVTYTVNLMQLDLMELSNEAPHYPVLSVELVIGLLLPFLSI